MHHSKNTFLLYLNSENPSKTTCLTNILLISFFHLLNTYTSLTHFVFCYRQRTWSSTFSQDFYNIFKFFRLFIQCILCMHCHVQLTSVRKFQLHLKTTKISYVFSALNLLHAEVWENSCK